MNEIRGLPSTPRLRSAVAVQAGLLDRRRPGVESKRLVVRQTVGRGNHLNGKAGRSRARPGGLVPGQPTQRRRVTWPGQRRL